MNLDQVREQVNETMHKGFEIPLEKLKPEATLFEDLGLDSLDAVDMLVYLEEKLDLKVDGEQFKDVRTLGDVHAMIANLVAQQGSQLLSKNLKGEDLVEANPES